MNLRPSGMPIRSKLAAAGCLLVLLSCGCSVTNPTGRLVVYVSENGTGPAVGKKIEVIGPFLLRPGVSSASQIQLTDENGLADFIVHAGIQRVRAHELGTPGPGRPFVEQSVEVRSSETSRVEFYDCSFCRAPSP